MKIEKQDQMKLKMKMELELKNPEKAANPGTKSINPCQERSGSQAQSEKAQVKVYSPGVPAGARADVCRSGVCSRSRETRCETRPSMAATVRRAVGGGREVKIS